MTGDPTRITSDGGVYRYGPSWSPDSKKLLYWDKTQRLWYVGVDDKKPVLVDKSDYGDIRDATWSPDSRWLTYSKPHRRVANDVFLYALEPKRPTQVSTGFYNANNPVFDQNGKYLYFISTRFFYPSVGQLDQRYNYYSTDGIFAVTLKSDEESPFKPQNDEEKAADEKKTDKKNDSDKKDEKKDEKKEEPVKPIQIDLDGIGTRVAPVPLPAPFSTAPPPPRINSFSLTPPRKPRRFATITTKNPPTASNATI